MSGLIIDELVHLDTNRVTMSLIGVAQTRPVRWGNYFSIEIPKLDKTVRVVNMWYENFEYLLKINTLSNPIRCRFFKDPKTLEIEWLMIIDDRVPVNYFYNKLCFTGSYLPPVEIAREMHHTFGTHLDELDYWIRPYRYHALRREVKTNGFISSYADPDIRKYIFSLANLPEEEIKEKMSTIKREFRTRS